jgi:Ca-activated chloride channel family protein
MKNLTSLLTLLLFVSFSSIMKTATAQQAAEEDKTLSPYFVVNGKHPGVDALPLKSTGAEVNIAGAIADVPLRNVIRMKEQRPSKRFTFPQPQRELQLTAWK